jgi:hypothetical protein
MEKFKVIGAGMAGLLAAAFLRDGCSRIVESQKEIPNNHSALLRFRSSIVGDCVNIPFRQVSVIKGVVGHTGNPVGDAAAYSLKTNGTATLRSVLSAKGEAEKRYIAPPDFISQLAAKVSCPVDFGSGFRLDPEDRTPIISTMPMPSLMNALGYDSKGIDFRSVNGFTITAKLDKTNLCATLYFTNPELPYYRASITDDRLIVEFAFPNNTMEEAAQAMLSIEQESPFNTISYLHHILVHFGMNGDMIIDEPVIRHQKYSKILPIDDVPRKRFILWASETFGIYSLGRFATWRPTLLLDDIINDVRSIQRMSKKTSYDWRK